MSNQPSAASGERRLATLEGVLERITYANEENGCTVARVDTGRGAGDLLTVVGALLGAQVGESLRMEGRWGSHPQYGKQFHVGNYTTVLPATVRPRWGPSGRSSGGAVVDAAGVEADEVVAVQYEDQPVRGVLDDGHGGRHGDRAPYMGSPFGMVKGPASTVVTRSPAATAVLPAVRQVGHHGALCPTGRGHRTPRPPSP